MEQQKGFSVIGVALVVLVIGVIGFVGFYVWQKSRPSKVEPAAATVTKTPTLNNGKEEANIPAGYVLYTSKSPKFSFVYPKEWDAVKTGGWSKGVNVEVYSLNDEINDGFGSPTIIKYDTNSKVLIRANKNDNTSQALSVLWKDSAKTVFDASGGDGPCGSTRAAFILEAKIIRVVTPTTCSRELEGDGKPGLVYLDKTIPAVPDTKVYYSTLAESITF